MSPPVKAFPSSSIPKILPKGLKSSTCPLKQLVQFDCILDDDETPICFPVVKTFKAYSPVGMKLIPVVLSKMEKSSLK